jgi:hypothetical protein
MGEIMNIIKDILFNKENLKEIIIKNENLHSLAFKLFTFSFICFFSFGISIGINHSLIQGLSSAIKLPFVYLLSLVICIPTLFIMNNIYGLKRNLIQTVVLLLTSTSLIGIVLLGFLPISFFFQLSIHNYQIIKIMNVAFFFISGYLGINYLSQTDIFFKIEGNNDNSYFLRVWFILYGLVGTQLGWMLRPFFGAPTMPYEFIRKIEGSFVEDIINSIIQIIALRK